MLRELIHERTGVFFDDDRTDLLAERLAPLVVERGFRSFLDLYYLLKYDEAAAREAWREVMDALSVPETYFWREVDQIRAIVCRVMPELARRGRPAIRIWSAPCASGEEPLTIAMALERGRLVRPRRRSRSTAATAARRRSPRRGRDAIAARAIRALPPALREKYFSRRRRRLHAARRAGAARSRHGAWSI